VAVKVLLSYDANEDDLRRIQAVSGGLVVEKAVTLEEAIAKAGEAEVIFAGQWSEELWRSAPRLRWVQSWGAGVERFLTADFVASSIVLTNARGMYAVPIADHVMALVLHFSRRLGGLVRSQLAHRWAGWEECEPEELAGKTMGIVGLGGIGCEVATRAKAFGMRVIATRRRPNLARSLFVDEVWSSQQLPWLLKESDYVAICAALTARTRHLIGERELGLMKPTAFLINIARGALVDEQALVRALQDGAIAGAGLDVFEEEPLPGESPLWEMTNVIITPHTAGGSPRSHERMMELFCGNLRRYLAGEPLVNVVDKNEGY